MLLQYVESQLNDLGRLANVLSVHDKNILYGKNLYTGAKLWDILNNETKQAINIKAFRRFIMLWNGPICSVLIACIDH